MAKYENEHEALRALSDEHLADQKTLHEKQLNFGEPARQDLHAYMLGLCDEEINRRRREKTIGGTQNG